MKTLCLLLACIAMSTNTGGQSIRMKDSSDWWSMNGEHYPVLTVKPVEEHFATQNFKILGLSLDTVDFETIASKLGKAPVLERGDASTGRSQVCYTSYAGSDKIHLVFEFGEGQSSTFYLFRGGADWNGSNQCVKSGKVTADLSTETGLRLGLSRAQVEAILGKPDFVKGDRIAYCREFYRKATKEEFEKSRQEYPGSFSDEAAHQQFDRILVTMQLEARFTNLQMSYLHVSTDSLNDN